MKMKIFSVVQVLAFVYISFKICTYEKIQDVPKTVTFRNTEVKPFDNFDEIDVLASIISAEALGEPYLGKLAVGSVVLNRVESSTFPSTIREVVFQKNQFHGTKSPLYKRADKDCYLAAKEVVQGLRTTRALYYANLETATNRGWIKYIKKRYPISEKIGNHTFFKLKKL